LATARPVLNQLNLVARDFDATLAFYRRLALEVPDGSSSPEGVRHAGLTLANGFSLEFDNEALAGLYNAAWRRPGGSNRVLIGFSLPSRGDVDRLYGELTGAGHKGIQPPYDAFWGARYAVLADPDGNHVGLMSPVEERRRSWPPMNSPEP